MTEQVSKDVAESEPSSTIPAQDSCHDPNSQVNGVVEGRQEIADPESLETVLGERERELIEAQRIAKLGTWRWTPSDGKVIWSEELYRIFERDSALTPLPFEAHSQVFVPESSARLATAMQTLMQTGEAFELDLEVLLPSGTRKWIIGRGESGRSLGGRVVQVQGTIQEITERKHVEEALREHAELLDLTHDMIMVCALDGTIRFWNHGAERMYGFSKQQAVGKNAHDLLQTIFPKPVAEIKAMLVRDGRWEGELQQTAQNGARTIVAGRLVLQRDKNGEAFGFMEINNDITERKRAEEALRASESRFRKLFESDLLGICIPDRFGAFYEGNEEFLRIVGYTRDDLEAGRVRWDVMTPPEYSALDAAHIAEAAERGGCTPYEKEYIRKDGVRVPIQCGYALLEGSKDRYIAFVQDLSPQKQAEAGLREREERFRVLAESLPQFVWIRDANGKYIYCNQRLLDYVGQPTEWLYTQAFDAVHPDDLNSTQQKWKHSLQIGEPYENEYRLRRHDGVYRYFLARAVPIRDEAGRIERWLGSSTEIHDQKLAEEALRRSEKLATAGRLAASMAHEINNPLASVVNAVYLALQDSTLTGETRDLLKAADQELARVAQFTTQTLRFHKQSTAPALVDLGEIMDSVFAMYAPRLRTSSIRLDRDYRTQEKLRCFNSELRQVFANLIGNALDAIGQKGRLRVCVKRGRAWDKDAADGIRVIVADTGHGIPVELRKRVFEPFVSTKEATGVGLGLWVTEGIIQKHSGRIALRSSTDPVRHGTVFSLFFPIGGLNRVS
jgi:PAS domain S-box-containing protein